MQEIGTAVDDVDGRIMTMDSEAAAAATVEPDEAFDDEVGVEDGEQSEKAAPLTIVEIKAMLRGFVEAGFHPATEPAEKTNPILVEWRRGEEVRRYKLWTFGVRPGGGQNSESRSKDEYRIQVTSGPDRMSDFDINGYQDILVGFYHEDKAVIVFDRYWLESLTRRYEMAGCKGSKGSNSAQIKIGQITGHISGDGTAEPSGVTGEPVAAAPAIRKVVKQLKPLKGSKDKTSPGRAVSYVMPLRLFPEYLNQIAPVPALAPKDVTEDVGTTAITLNSVRNTSGRTLDIVAYCEARGFTFEPDLIARYIAALLAKPLVILAGISGTGKSKLAELVAGYYSQTNLVTDGAPDTPAPGEAFIFQDPVGIDRDRLALVPVRPDWIDNKSILGFVNPISGRYESTQALDLILRAGAAADRAGVKAPRHFMILDEMNLAKVEHYFSDWLACTESRRLVGSTIVQQPVSLHRLATNQKTDVARADGTRQTFEVPPSIPLPTNLVVTGTVNVDETTHGFSSKVLDRSMVIEFDAVDLDDLRRGAAAAGTAGYRFPETLPAFSLPVQSEYARLPPETHAHLVAINKILEGARLHFGYRAATEMARFMVIYNDILPVMAEDVEWRRALDAAVLQKVLPRLSGNRAKLAEPLARLCAYLRDLKSADRMPAIDEFDPDAPAVLEHSYRRALEMWRGLASFGYVSFFK